MATSAVPMTAPRPTESYGDEDLHPVIAWIRARQKLLTYALGVVIVLGLVSWYVIESGRRKAAQAAAALDQARASLDAGNLPEASTEFQRVITVFSGTDAANEAVLGLNQARMLSGQSQLAVDELTKFMASSPPPSVRSEAQALLGMALENTGKFKEAAQAYEASAATASQDYLKVDALLGAARAYRAGGDDKKAVEVLEGIVKAYPAELSGVVEAKVRLAELTGGRL